jgi:CRISPR-associated endonuclease/helicase Cas3
MMSTDFGQYFAHSVKEEDVSCWQTLPQHSGDVANLAADLGAPLGLGKAAALAGLLHDLGKYDPAFQARLHGSKTPVDHSTAGAFVVRQLPGIDPGMAELIAYAIAGHHAGLPDGIAAMVLALMRRACAGDL